VNTPKSGARKHHPGDRAGTKKGGDGDVLSPADLDTAKSRRGDEQKRYLRAVAALRGIYFDTELAPALKVSERTLYGWWDGATPGPASIEKISKLSGLPRQELIDWLHYDGPPPAISAEEAEWLMAQGETLSTHPRDDAPRTPGGSSPNPRARPKRRRGGPS
jgi:hypothetical protein